MVLKKIITKFKDEILYTKNTLKSIIIKEGNSKNFLRFTHKFIKESLPKELSLEEITKIRELPDANEMKFPLLIDENFDNYIQKFMHSYREKEHPTININNLLFLTGTEKCGKSWFLRKNLKNFEEETGKHKNLAIHYDIREISNSNFQIFLNNFEREIITSLVNRNDFELETNKKDIITQVQLLDLLFYRWEKGWIEINLSKSISRALSETDSPYTYTIDKNQYYNELIELLQKYQRKAFKEYNLIENFGRIVEMIQENMQISNFEASILLVYDCLIQREDLRKPNINNIKIYENELYRDGIEVMEYLFDVLNYICGYHEIQNKKVILGDVDQPKQLYPHVVLALESVQEFFNMKDSERRAMDYMHRIMLRLYNNNGYRDHFPIIFESNKNYYFDQIIYNELFDHKWTYPTLFFDSQFYLREMENVLDIYLNNYQKEVVMRFLQKSSVYCYKYIIELIKSNGYQEFEKIFKIQTEFGSREFYRFYHKLNKIYIHPLFENKLDSGEIDHIIIDSMRQWHYLFIHNLDPFIAIRRKNYDFEFLNTPITRAMMDENIIVYHKYHKRLYFENYLYNYYNHQFLYFFIKDKLKGMKYCYHNLVFRFFKSFKFESNFFTIGKRKSIFRISARPWEWKSSEFVHGYNLKWDIPMELYKGDYKRNYMYENVIPTNRIL